MRYEDFNKKPDTDKKQPQEPTKPSDAERMIKHTKDARDYLSKQVKEQYTDMEIAAMEGGQEIPERTNTYVSALRQAVAEVNLKEFAPNSSEDGSGDSRDIDPLREKIYSLLMTKLAKAKGDPQDIAMAAMEVADDIASESEFVDFTQLPKWVNMVLNKVQGVAEATGDNKFDAMMGNIKKSAPVSVTGYVAVEYASENKSDRIKGVTLKGKPMPSSVDVDDLEGEIEFQPDEIERHLIKIGRDNGWSIIDPGHGRGYSELFFDTNANYTSDNQSILAKNIVNTVNEINKFFSGLNSSLQSTGLPGYRVAVWQEISSSNGQKIGDINQIKQIALTKVVNSPNDPGELIGQAILRELPAVEQDEYDDFTPEDFAYARKIAKIYITKGERAGLEAQISNRRMDHVSDLIDELLSLAGAQKYRTLKLDDLDEQSMAEGTESQYIAARYIDEFGDGDHWYVKGTPDVIKKFVLLANSLEDETVKGTEYEPGKGMMGGIHAELGNAAAPQWTTVPARNLESIKPIGDKVLQRLMRPNLADGAQEFMSELLWAMEAKGLALVHDDSQPGVAEDISSTKKKISKYEELALAANRAGDDAKCKQYQQKIQVLKQKMSQGVAEGYTGRETKDGTWRVFKDGQAVAVAGPFNSRDEAHAWIKKHKQGVAEAKSLKKRVRVVQGEHAGKTGWIREIKHGIHSTAPKRYYVDIDGGGQADNLPASALRLLKNQSNSQKGMTESDDKWSVEYKGKDYECYDQDHAINKARKFLGYDREKNACIIKHNGKPVYSWRQGEKIQPLSEGNMAAGATGRGSASR